jgi:hypothetical protein
MKKETLKNMLSLVAEWNKFTNESLDFEEENLICKKLLKKIT